MYETARAAGAVSRPLLLLINASADIDALVRSGERRVVRWSASGDSEQCFSGDPADPRTYRFALDASAVTAVIDLPDGREAEAVLKAVRSARPDAAVLLLSDQVSRAAGDGTVARAGTLRDVLRLDLEEELQRLEAERRAWCLRRFAAGSAVVPILIHPDPDPDAISSAFGVRAVLRRSPTESPLVTLGEIHRPENHRMVELLRLRVTVITLAELRAFEKVITVDMQPVGLGGDAGPRFAVIDHHPPERTYHAEFMDVRPGYGAVASMVTEYLRACDERRIGEPLATALLHGIRTDTDGLSRGVSADDVQAYAFLQERADVSLLRRMERPNYSAETVRAYGRALAGVLEEDGVVLAYAGELEASASHLLPEIADFCLDIETSMLAVATAFIDDELVFTLRYAGRGARDAGAVARAISAAGGRGGGHAAMARAMLPRALVRERFSSGEGELERELLRYVAGMAAAEVEEPAVSRRS